ncbi:hypothetical protein RhiJN_10270 [Ceratobasidium sp. AG-Ba]|nr:hypothetical protein RhiJN_10270 [Ceratobasidium sp. AG-Ba]
MESSPALFSVSGRSFRVYFDTKSINPNDLIQLCKIIWHMGGDVPENEADTDVLIVHPSHPQQFQGFLGTRPPASRPPVVLPYWVHLCVRANTLVLSDHPAWMQVVVPFDCMNSPHLIPSVSFYNGFMAGRNLTVAQSSEKSQISFYAVLAEAVFPDKCGEGSDSSSNMHPVGPKHSMSVVQAPERSNMPQTPAPPKAITIIPHSHTAHVTPKSLLGNCQKSSSLNSQFQPRSPHNFIKPNIGLILRSRYDIPLLTCSGTAEGHNSAARTASISSPHINTQVQSFRTDYALSRSRSSDARVDDKGKGREAPIAPRPSIHLHSTPDPQTKINRSIFNHHSSVVTHPETRKPTQAPIAGVAVKLEPLTSSPALPHIDEFCPQSEPSTLRSSTPRPPSIRPGNIERNFKETFKLNESVSHTKQGESRVTFETPDGYCHGALQPKRALHPASSNLSLKRTGTVASADPSIRWPRPYSSSSERKRLSRKRVLPSKEQSSTPTYTRPPPDAPPTPKEFENPNVFTEEEDQFVVDYMNWWFEQDAQASTDEIMEDIAILIPRHHVSHWKNRFKQLEDSKYMLDVPELFRRLTNRTSGPHTSLPPPPLTPKRPRIEIDYIEISDGEDSDLELLPMLSNKPFYKQHPSWRTKAKKRKTI